MQKSYMVVGSYKLLNQKRHFVNYSLASLPRDASDVTFSFKIQVKLILIEILPKSLLLLAGINYGLILPINSMVVQQKSSYFGHAF